MADDEGQQAAPVEEAQQELAGMPEEEELGEIQEDPEPTRPMSRAGPEDWGAQVTLRHVAVVVKRE